MMSWHWNWLNYSVEIAETWQHMKDSLVWCYPMKAGSPDTVSQTLALLTGALFCVPSMLILDKE